MINFSTEIRHLSHFFRYLRERMRGEGGSEIHFQSLPKSMMRRFMDEKEDKVVKLKIEIFKF